MGKVILHFTVTVFWVFYQFKGVSQYYFYNSNYYEAPITWETGVSAGAMNCLTDLGGKKGMGSKFLKDISWKSTRFCGSIYAGASYCNMVGARLEFSFGQVSAADSLMKNDQTAPASRYRRNLSFRSDIMEVLLISDFYPLMITSWNVSAVSPYVFAGIGIFKFNPEGRFNNAWVSLPLMHTEGQGFSEYPGRKPYKLRQYNFPFGLGLKFERSAIFTLRMEMTYRKVWTDYLDDVSTTYIDPALFDHYLTPRLAALAKKAADRGQEARYQAQPGAIRGNPNSDDAYFSFNLKIGFVFGRQRI